MSDTPLSIRVPGKLMLAGEFAVLEPYNKLIVTAVNRFVYTRIEKKIDNRLTLENFDLKELTWHWSQENEKLEIDTEDKRTAFVQIAMEVALTYLNELSIYPETFHLSIRSELDDVSGIKYGLGSSAAVVTAAIRAILTKFMPNSPKPDVIFKLASIAHVQAQGNGSGADIAASVYGGVLEYASYQADWLLEAIKHAKSISGLVTRNWKYLSITPISLPEELRFCVGWTGSPASTKKLVTEILKLKRSHPQAFTTFLNDSNHAMEMLLRGVREQDMVKFLAGIKENRKALANVGLQANVPIETPLLGILCSIAEENNGAGKPSGAGGGDCGIAFVTTKKDEERLKEAWKSAGIKPLQIGRVSV